MGPPDPKDVAKDIARELTTVDKDLTALNAEAYHWLTAPEYAALRHRLQAAHAAVEAAMVEARRRVRLDEGREQ